MFEQNGFKTKKIVQTNLYRTKRVQHENSKSSYKMWFKLEKKSNWQNKESTKNSKF